MCDLRLAASMNLAAMLLVLNLSGPSVVLAQSEEHREDYIEQMKTIAARTLEYQASVARWERYSTIIILLVVAVGVMGIVISILQGVGTNVCRTMCIVMGALVGTITLINSTLFPADHRAFGFSAIKAHRLLNELRVLPSSDPSKASPAVLASRVERGLKLIKQIEDIEENLYRSWSAPDQSQKSAFISSAFAGDILPTFRGVGEARTLGEARGTAFTLAEIAAATAVARDWAKFGSKGSSRAPGQSIDPFSVRPFVQKVADVVQEDTAEGRGFIQYTVRLGLKSEFLRGLWSESFVLSRPEPIRSGERVLLQVTETHRLNLGPDSALRHPYLGLKGDQVGLVAPARAMNITIISSVGFDDMITDNAIVRLSGRDGNIGDAGDRLGMQVEDRTRFIVRRTSAASSSAGNRSSERIIRDGDALELRLESTGKTPMVSDGELVLGRGPAVVMTVIRVAKTAQRQWP